MAFDIKYYKIVSQFAKVTIAQYIDKTATSVDLISAGFFNSIANQLDKGSLIFANTDSGTIILVVDSVQDGDVVVSKYAGANVTRTVEMPTGEVKLTSTIRVGDTGGSIICDLTGTTLKDAAVAQITDNWIIYQGSTGLVLDSVVYVDANTARLVFSGVAKEGTISIAPTPEILLNQAATAAGSYIIA